MPVATRSHRGRKAVADKIETLPGLWADVSPSDQQVGNSETESVG